jgi:methionyl-tRNA synthetase
MAKMGETEALAGVLYTCLDVARMVSILLMPVMPNAAAALRKQIGLRADSAPTWDEAREWALLPVGTKVAAPEPLFPRIMVGSDSGVGAESIKVTKEKRVDESVTEVKQRPVEETSSPPAEYITIDDFLKVQLRVANIETAETVPNADKLLKLTVNLGGEARTILAGIAEMYQPDELVGKQIVVVANLQPRKMRGIESQGMLLAADVDGQAIILQPETEVPAGSRVR